MSVRNPALSILLSFGAAAAIGCVVAGCGDGDASNEVILEVNGQPITRGEYQTELRRRYGPLTLKKLVDRSITAGLARKQGVEPDEARVQWKMDLAESQAGGRAALEKKLAARNQALDDLRKSLEQEALAEQVMAAQVAVSDKEIEDYYAAHKDEFKHGDMIKGRLMLLESRQNAEEIHKILDEPGADFAGLAEALSMDPGTKDEQGDMGWIERGDYTSEISDAAFKLEPGQYTGVIEYPDGYAIVLVEDKKPPGYKPLDGVRDTVESMVRREKEAELRPTWAVEQRKRARIKVFDRDLAERFSLIRDR